VISEKIFSGGGEKGGKGTSLFFRGEKKFCHDSCDRKGKGAIIRIGGAQGSSQREGKQNAVRKVSQKEEGPLRGQRQNLLWTDSEKKTKVVLKGGGGGMPA